MSGGLDYRAVTTALLELERDACRRLVTERKTWEIWLDPEAHKALLSSPDLMMSADLELREDGPPKLRWRGMSVVLHVATLPPRSPDFYSSAEIGTVAEPWHRRIVSIRGRTRSGREIWLDSVLTDPWFREV